MQRFVLLGASNLTRGFSTVVSLCQTQPGISPLHIYCAMGDGRSYGNWSRLFSRKLPGILQCGLWDALSESQIDEDKLQTAALITDIGNDLLYGISPEELTGWILQCVEKLQEQNAKIVMTLPPIESLQSISPWRFFLFRKLLFPKATKSFSQLSDEVRELDSRLRDLAKIHSLILKEPDKDWYGFDPIHVRKSCRAEAWQAILTPMVPGIFQSDSNTHVVTGSPKLPKTIRPQLTKYKRRFGKNDREVHISQPCINTENLIISSF